MRKRQRNEIDEARISFHFRLGEFLSAECKNSNVTVDDIKDIVWNDYDHHVTSRMAFILAEQNPKTKFEDIIQMMQDAWNHFPHKGLNGLSPQEMVVRAHKDEGFTADKRRDFYEIFKDTFPQETALARRGGNDWEWEFSAQYHALRAKLEALAADEEQGHGGSEAENEAIDALRFELLDMLQTSAAKEALDNDLLQFDAAILLAHDAWHEDEGDEAMRILEESIFEARKKVPAEFKIGKDRMPWSFLDNRPFLRLLGEYATLTEKINGPQKAIPLYQELLALNPNDNQGMREMLATAYIKTNRLEDLLKLDKQYPDDMMPGLKMGALLALYKLGRLDEAKKRMTQTKKRFPLVLKEILKREHPQPELTEGRVQVGGEDEAWIYWQEQGTFWMAAPGAREFLREHLEKK